MKPLAWFKFKQNHLVNKRDFSHIARFCIWGFVRISETNAKAKFVSFREAEAVDIWLAELVICEHSHRAAQADRADSERPGRKHDVLSEKSAVVR